MSGDFGYWHMNEDRVVVVSEASDVAGAEGLADRAGNVRGGYAGTSAVV